MAEFHRRATAHPAVKLICGTLSQAELVALQLSATVFVSLHAAEGIGLGVLELMRLGIPSIVSNYSGSVDFTNGETAFLVPVDMVSLIFARISRPNAAWLGGPA